MGFFDLNIPYMESTLSDKTAFKAARIKLVIKAMELGYTGIAYNHTIKGVMSDQDQCSISFLSLSTLLKVAPSLSSSVGFHRDLLGVPRSAPFRQYTRLTVCVDSIAQGQVLNSGNPILKSYDLVAVRPLNQSAFDYASEKSEVDIISIDFSEKLPFRLKQHMVKAAIERAVYFEVTYSDLIVDVQVRRQMISNVKLLVDWTRGKNIIFSSAAPSANVIRGPYDVANLSFLFGLSMEQAKTAISKNCRILIGNALKKKHFYKEAIRVELLTSGGGLHSKESWSGDWLKWDPISSGEGDLLLDDMAKSFSASNKVSKTVQAVNFASLIDSIPSQGFQVKDLTPETRAVSLSPENGNSFCSATEVTAVPVVTDIESKDLYTLDFLARSDQISLDNTAAENQSSDIGGSEKLSVPCNATKIFTNAEETGTLITTIREEPKNSIGLDVLCTPLETDKHTLQSFNSICSHELDVQTSYEKVTCQTSPKYMNQSAENQTFGFEDICSPCLTDNTKDTSKTAVHMPNKEDQFIGSYVSKVIFRSAESQNLGLQLEKPISSHQLYTGLKSVDMACEVSAMTFEADAASHAGATGKVSRGISTPTQREGSKNSEGSDIELGSQSIVNIFNMEKDINNQRDTHLPPNDATMHEFSEKEPIGCPEDDAVGTGQFPLMGSYDNMKVEDDCSVANHEVREEAIVVKQKQGEAHSEIDNPTSIYFSGKPRVKQGTHRQAFSLPLKRLLTPISFKKKAKKSKRRKMV